MRFCVLCLPLFALALVSSARAQSQRETSHDVATEMRNVVYHYTDDIGVDIQQLKGNLVPKKDIPVFDDTQSFTLQIDSATISISTEALGHVLNDYVFAAKDAPLKELVLTTEGNQLKIKGKLAQKGGISFETLNTMAVTADGRIRLHAGHIKAAHLPMKGIMDLFGVKLADLINTKKVTGVSTEKDDVILDLSEILPPPQIQGKLAGVRIENGQIVQIYGTGNAGIRSGSPKNFMAYRGATLRFGKLTMSDTDLMLIDADPKDLFDFYLAHYRDQLVAGYTKTTPQFGLRVYMVDWNKLRKENAGRRQAGMTAQK